MRSAGYAAAAILQNGLAGAAIADVSQSCTPFFDDLLKACLSVHYLEKILRSSTLSLEEAKAGRLAVPRSNRLSICPTVLNGRACPWCRYNLSCFVRADGEQSLRYSGKRLHFSTIAPKGTATAATCAGAGVRSTMLQTRSLEGKLTSSSQRVPRGVRTATEKDFSGRLSRTPPPSKQPPSQPAPRAAQWAGRMPECAGANESKCGERDEMDGQPERPRIRNAVESIILPPRT